MVSKPASLSRKGLKTRSPGSRSDSDDHPGSRSRDFAPRRVCQKRCGHHGQQRLLRPLPRSNPLSIGFPGCSSLPLLDPGLSILDPYRDRKNDSLYQILKGIGLKAGLRTEDGSSDFSHRRRGPASRSRCQRSFASSSRPRAFISASSFSVSAMDRPFCRNLRALALSPIWA
jgi:hypothetical protein